MANKPSNPNSANQYQLDPRQKLCWEFYIDPRSETFGNATRSAIKAGYTAGTADVITNQDWFSGRLRRLNMRIKAEKVLQEMMEMSDENVVIDKEGETVKKRDPALTRIKQDTAKFAAERLGKDEWSSRQELTGAEGTRLIPLDADEESKIHEAIERYLNPAEGVAGDDPADIEGGHADAEEDTVSVQPEGPGPDGDPQV